MADYRQPADVLKRVRFYDGQFLTDQDFVDEQIYHLDRARRTNRGLGLTGVLDGLAVTVDAARPYQVTVAPGSGVDPTGRHLVITAPVTVTLPTDRFSGVSGVQVRLFYGETATDQAQTGGLSNRRWQESPVLAAVGAGAVAVEPPEAPTRWDDDGVLLGTVSVSAKGDVTITPGAAPRAGLDPKGPFRGAVSIAGHLAVGTGAAWNPAGWNRVVDLFGPDHSRFLVRNATTTGFLATHPGYGGSPGGVILGAETSHPVTLTTANLPRLSVTSAGRVGIGTTDPGAALHVAGAGKTNVDLIVNGRIRSANNDGGIWFGEDRFIGGVDTDKIGIFGNSFWQMVFTKNGDVGIGTSAPQTNTAWGRVVDFLGAGNTNTRLSIRNATATSVFGSVLAGAYSALTGAVVGTETDHAATVVTTGLARLTVTGGGKGIDSGRVGIGLTAPQARLHVAGTTTGTAGTNVDLLVDGRIRSSGTEGGLWVGTDRFVGGVPGGRDGKENMIGFFTKMGWALTVSPDGHVSIGNTTTSGGNGDWSRVLDIAGDRAVRTVLRTRTMTGVMGLLDGPPYREPMTGLVVGTETAHSTVLMTASTARLTVQADGDVVIGTKEVENRTGWNRQVDIYGQRHARLLVRSGDGVRGFLAVHQDAVYDAPAGKGVYVGTEEVGDLNLVTRSRTRMTIEADSGDVYVHSKLWMKLESNWGTEPQFGPANQRFWWTVGRTDWNLNSPNHGGAWMRNGRSYTVSDGRLKEDLRELPDALAMVRQLRGVTYRWNEAGLRFQTRRFEDQVGAGPEGTEADHEAVRAELRELMLPGLRELREVGLVAQEVEAVLPEIVGTDADGVRGIDYEKLTAVLVQAVKEQQQNIDTMQHRLSVLETREELEDDRA